VRTTSTDGASGRRRAILARWLPCVALALCVAGCGLGEDRAEHALARARELLGQLAEGAEAGYQPSFEIAKVHVALGEHDAALRRLERAFDERSHSMVFLEVDPQLAPLRALPAFGELVARVGLKDPRR